MRRFKPKKEGIYKLTAVVITALLSVTSSGVVAKADGETKDYGLRNPRVAFQTRETVYFGNYWQEDTNGDGVADKNDDKTPIQWQILKKYDDGTALLLSNKILDAKSYFKGIEKTRMNEETGQEEKYIDYSCTWETSDIRKWLNGSNDGDFYKEAFSSEEQNSIYSSNVENINYKNEKIDDTTDKIYLPSQNEMIDKDLLFVEDAFYNDNLRIASLSLYAKTQGCENNNNDGIGSWILRTPANSIDSITVVGYEGLIGYSSKVYNNDLGIRPVLRIDLSDSVVNKGEDVKVSLLGSEWNTIIMGKYNDQNITWRVLNVNEDDALLISDKIIEFKSYNDERIPTTWENSTLRKWLNDEFYNNAFNDEEKRGIKTTNVINVDDAIYENKKGEDTQDKIFLLSIKDAVNSSYGFIQRYGLHSDTRVALDSEGIGREWWLRSIGYNNNFETYIGSRGYGYDSGTVVSSCMGVRPCLHIDLSSFAWKKGEPVKVGDPTGGTEIPLDPNSRTDFPIDNSKNDTTESNQTTEAKNPEQPVDSKTTPKTPDETFMNAGAGVGKISSDGKKLVDTDNKTWQMSNKLENKDLKKSLNVAVKNGGKYKITKVTKNGGKVTGGTVTYMAPYDKNCKLISATGIVKLAGVNFKVTQIAPKCAKGCKKLKKVVIGSYVANVGANAFSGCSSLTTVTIKKGSLTTIGAKAFFNCKKLNSFSVTGLKLKKVGSNAFKNTNSKITFKCPKSKLKDYTKFFKKAGASKKAKYTK